MTSRRLDLRSTFDSAASLYQEARPDYPPELYDDLLRSTALQPGARLLEVGSASGKATIPFAREGFPITCVELGPALVAQARNNLASFPQVDVVCADFETWQSPAGSTFDLVFAATAWRWVDPAIRYRKAWTLLRPGGHLAFWNATHVFPRDADPFFYEIQDVYDELGEGLPGDSQLAPGELPDDTAEIAASDLFDVVHVRHLDWETTYTTEEYLTLLDTFSNHIAMDAGKRRHLYSEVRRRLAGRPGGRLRRHWGAVLHVARRRGTIA